jgi:hypothetical protein
LLLDALLPGAGVGVGVAHGFSVGVAVGAGVGVGVAVGAGVGVGVAVGAGVGVGVAVGAGVGVGVAVGAGVGVGVAVGAVVGVGLGVGFGVAVGAGLGDGVAVGAAVGVGVGTGPQSTTFTVTVPVWPCASFSVIVVVPSARALTSNHEAGWPFVVGWLRSRARSGMTVTILGFAETADTITSPSSTPLITPV